MTENNVVGKTRDSGFQIGVRRTFPVTVTQAWDYLFSAEGLQIWLGNSLNEESGNDLTDKIVQIPSKKVNVCKPYSHIRIKWAKEGWKNVSLLQMRVIAAKGKATISFHQEKLLDAAQRMEMKLGNTTALK